MAYTVTGCVEYEGGVAKDGDLPTPDGKTGARLSDGDTNTSVRCSISSSPDGGYLVDLNLSGPNVDAAIPAESAGLVVGLEIHGTVTADGGSGQVILRAMQTFESSAPCTLNAAGDQGFEIGHNRVYGTFECDEMRTTDGLTCMAFGVFAFDLCPP